MGIPQAAAEVVEDDEEEEGPKLPDPVQLALKLLEGIAEEQFISGRQPKYRALFVAGVSSGDERAYMSELVQIDEIHGPTWQRVSPSNGKA